MHSLILHLNGHFFDMILLLKLSHQFEDEFVTGIVYMYNIPCPLPNENTEFLSCSIYFGVDEVSLLKTLHFITSSESRGLQVQMLGICFDFIDHNIWRLHIYQWRLLLTVRRVCVSTNAQNNSCLTADADNEDMFHCVKVIKNLLLWHYILFC